MKHSTVHPHTRGEHHPGNAGKSHDSGSSPHTWGTHVTTHLFSLIFRFIPTHVGNTRRTASRRMP